MFVVVVGLFGLLSFCGDILVFFVGRFRIRFGVCLGVCLMVGRFIRLFDFCCIFREWRLEVILVRVVLMLVLISSWFVVCSFIFFFFTIFNGFFCFFIFSLGEFICLVVGRIGVFRDFIEDRGVFEGVTRGEGFSGKLFLEEDFGGGCSGWLVLVRMVGSCEVLILFKVEERLILFSFVIFFRFLGL